ncbi:MAG: iron uptake porin [Cyanobacteria bacterium P01_F01_bin.42]
MSSHVLAGFLLMIASLVGGVAASAGAESLPTVSSFSDIEPTDWAYQALESLMERYGCIAGYPDGTFRGDRPLGRYEMVAALNACLDSLEGQSVSKEDLETVRAIQDEMLATLSNTRQQIERLEGRANTLEAQQFSTTTKLQGEVIIAGQFGDFADTFVTSNNLSTSPSLSDILPTPDGTGQGTPTITDQIFEEPRGTAIAEVKLSLNTSFNGRDNLNTVLETGNGGTDYLTALGLSGPVNPFPVPPDATANDRLPLVALGGAEFAGTGPEVSLYRLAYTFRPSRDVELTVGTNVYPSDFVDSNSYANDEAADFSSGFFINNPLIVANNIDEPGGAGGAIDWSISDRFNLRALYIGASPTEAAGADGGLFNAPYQISGELEYSDDFGKNEQNNVAVRLQFTRSTTRNSFTVQNVLGVNAEASFGQFGLFGRYGISLDPKLGNGFGGGDLFQFVPGVNNNTNIQTWMAGLGIRDLFKENALLGFAAGQPFLISNSLAEYSPQTNFEVFYRFPVGDNISLTPSIQYVLNPFNIEPAPGQPDNSLLQFILRTTFSF